MDWAQTLTIIISISVVVISVNMITANSLNKRIDDLREMVLVIMNHLLPRDVQNPSESRKKKKQ